MRKTLLLVIVMGLSASMLNAGRKCDEAQADYRTKLAAINTQLIRTLDEQGQKTQKSLRKKVIKLHDELKKTTGQDEERCERLMNKIAKKLKKLQAAQ